MKPSGSEFRGSFVVRISGRYRDGHLSRRHVQRRRRARAGDRGQRRGHAGPGSTYSPTTLVHATLSPGVRLSIPWRADYNSLAYVMAGHCTVGVEANPVQTGQLAVFGPGTALAVAAGQFQEGQSPNFDVLLLGGRPSASRSPEHGFRGETRVWSRK